MSGNRIEMNPFGGKSPHVMVSEQQFHSHGNAELGPNGGGSTSTSRRQQQLMERKFGSLSILALSITLLASWESIASGFAPGLLNGGPSALIWGMVFSFTGIMAMALSLAEMASICPLAGAQYHWTALLAPPRIRAFVTWLQGWITVFGWQAAVTSICYLMTAQIQGLLVLNYPDYTPQRWQGTLMMWAVMLICFAINVYAINILPVIQLFGGIMHVAFFITLIVPLILLAPRSTPEFVFATLLNEGGWPSDGISWCIGLLTVTYCFIGFDGAIHMSEEVRDAPRTIPRIIVQTIAINGALAFAITVVLLFFIGDPIKALSTPTGIPIIQIFYQATGSVKAASAMLASITIIGFASNIGVVASVSRLTWAFARDGGMPFSQFFAYVDPYYHVPFRAIGLVCFTVILLSLINIGSTTALGAIMALTTSSLLISYLIPIAMMVIRRLQQGGTSQSGRGKIVFGPWTLGRWGLFINIYAIIFGLFVAIFVPFPSAIPVTVENMNYSGPVFVGFLLIILIDWLLRGRGRYTGPLKELVQSSTM